MLEGTFICDCTEHSSPRASKPYLSAILRHPISVYIIMCYILAMKIQMSGTTHDLLPPHCRYDVIARGNVELKGKGMWKTYWLEEVRE